MVQGIAIATPLPVLPPCSPGAIHSGLHQLLNLMPALGKTPFQYRFMVVGAFPLMVEMYLVLRRVRWHSATSGHLASGSPFLARQGVSFDLAISDSVLKLVALAFGSMVYEVVGYATASERERQQHADVIEGILDSLRTEIAAAKDENVRAPTGAHPHASAAPLIARLPCRPATT